MEVVVVGSGANGLAQHGGGAVDDVGVGVEAAGLVEEFTPKGAGDEDKLDGGGLGAKKALDEVPVGSGVKGESAVGVVVVERILVGHFPALIKGDEGGQGDDIAALVADEKANVGVASAVVGDGVGDISAAAMAEVADVDGAMGMGISDMVGGVEEKVDQLVGAVVEISLCVGGHKAQMRVGHGEASPIDQITVGDGTDRVGAMRIVVWKVGKDGSGWSDGGKPKLARLNGWGSGKGKGLWGRLRLLRRLCVHRRC